MGGRPPKDNRRRGVRAAKIGVFVQDVANELMLVDELILKAKNNEEVIVIYVNRAVRVSEGLNWITRAIQPRWAIEE